MNNLNKIRLIILFFSIPTTLFATETGYIVELIIFEDVNSRYINSEDWSFNDRLLHAKAPENGKAADKDPEYAVLGWKSAKLAKNLERIIKNSNYHVLVKKRWKQTGLNREDVINIPINTKVNGKSDSLKEIHNINEGVEKTFTDTAETTSYISGQVKLIMSRYLHFNVDLHYFKPQINENGDRVLISYPVASERRMKSKEIHYIDHPMIGVIVLATPYKIKSGTSGHKPATYKTL